jgi:GntR family transcriptional regulator
MMRNLPAYRRIYEDLAARIRSGELQPDSRLPGDLELAERYGVARMTVRQAVAGLVDQSLVERKHGVGTFVAGDSAGRRSLNRLTSFSEDMRGSGQELATEILSQATITPTPEIAKGLALGKGAQVVFVARVRIVGGTPRSMHHSYLPYGEFPSLDREPLVHGSLYKTLEQVYDVRPRRADQRIRAVAATRDVAKRLEVPVRSPVLQTERLTIDERNIRIEFARSWMRPDLELTIHLER